MRVHFGTSFIFECKLSKSLTPSYNVGELSPPEDGVMYYYDQLGRGRLGSLLSSLSTSFSRQPGVAYNYKPGSTFNGKYFSWEAKSYSWDTWCGLWPKSEDCDQMVMN